jgi:hypothetical protein
MAGKAGKIELAVRRDLRALDSQARRSGLAEAALELARRLDVREVADRDAATLARELRATLTELRMVRPATPEKDNVDELNARRAARRGA